MSRDPFVLRVLDHYDTLVPVSPPTEPAEVVEEVRQDLEENLRVCAPKNCGISRVTARRDGWDDESAQEFEERIDPPGPLFRLEGIDDMGRRPLRVRLLFLGRDVHVTFILTPGRDASPEDYGLKLTGRHNVVVLALLGLSGLRLFTRGYRRILDSPIDRHVRRLYTKIGFENGEVLDLTDRRRIETMADFAARCLSLFRLDPSQLRY
ncbi:MAG: hypothetical protein HY922_13205 [Elusimicrobia bacterium]|nr:hypothetical protein [Elusimicrobiota bacterium]